MLDFDRRLLGRHGTAFLLLVAETAEHFEPLAARGKHAAAGTLVQIHGVHELDLRRGVVALASRGVDLAAAAHLGPPLDDPTFGGHGHVARALFRRAAAVRLAL